MAIGITEWPVLSSVIDPIVLASASSALQARGSDRTDREHALVQSQ